MKKLLLIGLGSFAMTAFADAPTPPSQPSGQPHYRHHQHHQHHHDRDPSVQATVLMNTAVTNSAMGFFGRAEQNLASRVGNVGGDSPEVLLVMARNSVITNESTGGIATQNIASNTGNHDVQASKYQMAIFSDSSVINRAGFGGRAVQNISANTNCLTCDSGPHYND